MPAIKESLRAGLTVGNLAGYPLIYVRAVVYDVKIMQDTSEAAISMASSLALKKALSKVGGVLLEPHMRFEITTPDEYVGSIISDLNRKQAQVREVESRVGVSVLRGYVALSKMFGYADALRSMTQGHGFYLLEPYEYRPVPEDEVKRMLGEFI
jgi:elongation factor G